jgi:hypothetical protein
LFAETSRPEIAEIRGRLAEAGAALARATQFILDCLTTNPETADAAATPYLDLLATVLGGYALARAAVLAAHHLEAAGDDTDFYTAKLATAHIFATAILPNAGAREREIRDSSTLLATFPETLI